MSEDDKQYKLFVKNVCMVCSNKAMSCYYCNGIGTVYVEASDRGVGRWLASIDENRMKSVLDYAKGTEDENN